MRPGEKTTADQADPIKEKARLKATEEAKKNWGKGFPKIISLIATFVLGILTLPLGTQAQYNKGVEKGVSQESEGDYKESHFNLKMFFTSLLVGMAIGAIAAFALGASVPGTAITGGIGALIAVGVTGGTLLNRANMKRLGHEEGASKYKSEYKQAQNEANIEKLKEDLEQQKEQNRERDKRENRDAGKVAESYDKSFVKQVEESRKSVSEKSRG